MTDPLDRIYIRDLRLRCIIGVNPEERDKKQDIVVNLILGLDLSAAAASDDLDDTCDYATLKETIVRQVESSEFLLLERLAQMIADTCLACDDVREVCVSVDKPGALRYARSVAVELTRRRHE